jgi:NAD(P)-dependent dehydrogenase (short-subunit alcohol dehydrogenase family)
MQKTLLLTGATDGIGLETAKKLALQGHHILMHGRNEAKLKAAVEEVAALNRNAKIESYVADLSVLSEVSQLATQVSEMHGKLDVIINNAGVFATPNTLTNDGLDVRFAVNTIAPYILTRQLLPLLNSDGRVVNLSSAAQAPVDVQAMVGRPVLSDNGAYAQSKLAITMWTQAMAAEYPNGPVFVAVNPASFLGSKMVKEAYGVAGNDMNIGAYILVRAALSDEFENASGLYFDNDIGKFAKPHNDAQNTEKVAAVMSALDQYL